MLYVNSYLLFVNSALIPSIALISYISALISELKPLVQDIGDATLIVPLIKEYMELGLKNDEALIKVATIFQRIFANEGNEDNGFGISEEEKEQLLKDIKNLQLPPKKEDEE